MAIRSLITPSVVLLCSLLLAGCGSPRLAQQVPAGRSFVAIHLDVSEAPHPWVSALYLESDAPGADLKFKDMRRQGKTTLFYLEDIPGGTCWVRTALLAGSPMVYLQLPRDPANPTATRVGSGEFCYMGSFKYKSKNKGSGEFWLERVDTPSEKDVAARLLPDLEGTGWKVLVARRLGVQ